MSQWEKLIVEAIVLSNVKFQKYFPSLSYDITTRNIKLGNKRYFWNITLFNIEAPTFNSSYCAHETFYRAVLDLHYDIIHISIGHAPFELFLLEFF